MNINPMLSDLQIFWWYGKGFQKGEGVGLDWIDTALSCQGCEALGFGVR
jgi:hypothetical protein